MKKIFKFIVTAVIAVAAAVASIAVAGCIAGCNTDGGKADYTFTVYNPDGTAINGQTGGRNGGPVDVQICLNACVPLLPEYSLDKNGKLSLSQKTINELFDSDTNVTEFTFHAMNVPGCKSDVEIEVHGKGNYTLTLETSVCEHKCLICGKCTTNSTEPACAEKCADHTYTINVTADGASLSGVKVKFTNGENSMQFSLTNGMQIKYKQLITTSVGAAASYKVTLENVPQGYTCSPAEVTVSDTQTVAFTLTAAE